MQISSNLNNPAINSTRDYLPPSLSDAKVEKGDQAKAIDGYADSVVISVGGQKIEAPLLSSRISGECKPVKLPEQEAPKLERPVLFLHGYMGKPEEFKEMSEWMTREGQNVDGGIVKVDNLNDLNPKANMFTLAFTKPYQTMAVNAAEIKATVEAICKATGSETVDIVAHSKGGLDARTYMMDADERVDHIVTIGSPHKGSPLANLELVVREELNKPVFPPIKDPQINKSLREISVDTVNSKGQHSNQVLHDLNENWNIQSGRAEYLAISGRGVLTITEPAGLSFKGDGVVSLKSSSALKGAAKGQVKHERHGNLPQNAKVMLKVADFLTGQTSPAAADDEFITETNADLAASNKAADNNADGKLTADSLDGYFFS